MHVVLVDASGELVENLRCEIDGIKWKLFGWLVQELDHGCINIFPVVVGLKFSDFVDKVEFRGVLFKPGLG